MTVRMIITLDSGVRDGKPTWCTQVPKAWGDSPRSGYPKDPNEGISGPQIGVLCSMVLRPRRKMVILN